MHRWHAIIIGYSQLIKQRKMCVTISKLEFRESDMSPGKAEVKQGKFGSPVRGYFGDTYKSRNINPIWPTPKFTLGIILIKVKAYQLVFSRYSIKIY